MLKRSLLIAGLSVSIAGSASASTTDNTTTAGPITALGIYVVNSGHSSYSSFWFNDGSSCGTNYGANGIRVSTGHPRYQEMLRTLLAAELSGGWVTYYYENISGQCWLKQIAVFMPGT